MFRRRKVCKFCADKIDDINYKDVKLLGPFVPERGKILPRRISGTCAMHQRKLQDGDQARPADCVDCHSPDAEIACWQDCRLLALDWSDFEPCTGLQVCTPAVSMKSYHGSDSPRTCRAPRSPRRDR